MIAVAGGLGVLMLYLFIRSGKPVRNFFASTLGGAAAFWALNQLAGLTGVMLHLNLASAVTAMMLGAPGICSLWLLRLLWG